MPGGPRAGNERSTNTPAMRTKVRRSMRFSRRQSVGGRPTQLIVRNPPGGHLEGRVGAEGVVVVEILVAQGDSDDPLGDHRFLVMDDVHRVARVRDGLVGEREAGLLTNLPQQERPGIGSEPAPQEVGDQGLGAEAGKGQGRAITVCHRGGLSLGGSGLSLTQTLQKVRPSRNYIINTSCEKSGLAGRPAARSPPATQERIRRLAVK